MNHVEDLPTYRALLMYCQEKYAPLRVMQSETEIVTFAELIDRVCKVAAYIDQRPEDYFTIECQSPIHYAIAYLGIVSGGRIACLTPPGHAIPDSLDHAGMLTDDIIAKTNNFLPFSSEQLPRTDPEKPCTIAFSSGTSAEPKGIVLSQKNLLHDAQSGLRRYQYWCGERLVHVLPYWHLFGIVADLLAPLQAGSELYMIESPLQFFSALRSFKPHSVNLPPALADAVCAAMETAQNADSVTGGALKKMMCAGAPLSIQTTQKLLSYGIQACAAYGLTECSPCVSLTGDGDVHPGTSGKPLDCVEVRISEEGEILVRGSTVMLGYLNNTTATSERIRDEWLYTGDLGYIDRVTGHLIITGRKSNMLVFSNGTKCVPEVIEQKIASIVDVDECLLRSSQKGEYAVLTVVSQKTPFKNQDYIDVIMRNAGLFPYRMQIQKEKLKRNALGKVVRVQ